MSSQRRSTSWARLMFFIALALTAIIYWPGLSGGWLFDDYPNIVDNHGVQPQHATLSSLVNAALSSPSSEFKRPLASLTFAINFLASGLEPFDWKLVNLVIHLINGLLVFLLAKRLLATRQADEDARRSSDLSAALIAAGWLLLPINLTGVLYVVQRMESLANLFVLGGLLAYIAGRQHMLAGRRGIVPCLASLILPTAVGLLAKETAVMLPLYAILIEWIMFDFAAPPGTTRSRDWRLLVIFGVILVLPLIVGLAWLLPGVLRPATWATRDFTLSTRLLSEARIIVDYVAWILFPTPQALSFYHDDFRISSGLLTPWTTLPSIVALCAMMIGVFSLRRRYPATALGLALYLACHLLTGTILPLELIYEHRNYFASFGVLLAVVPWLAKYPAPMALPRRLLLGGLLLEWATLTLMTAYAWGNPLRLAQDLASRAPASPRAQYELGRTYIIYSHYDPMSPFITPAYTSLEKAARLPESSILPEQALIFMNARMHRPLKDLWWDSMITKLKARKPGVQDESSLSALTKCAVAGNCLLPKAHMIEAFMAALSHKHPSSRLLATYSDYTWNVLDDHPLGLQLAEEAAQTTPEEPAYRITLVRMLVALGEMQRANEEMIKLEALNVGGRLNQQLAELHPLLR